MTFLPRVSVLLPAWNAADTLIPCLRSLERQTEPSWEAVVVDDGSTDATARLLAGAARADPRIRVVATAHQGLIGALNDGLRHVRAPLVARMDADDVMHRDRLRLQADALDAQPDLAAVTCHVRIFPRPAMSPRLLEYESWLNGMRSPDDVARDVFVECPVAHPALMMRREMAGLGYRDCGWPEDYDLVLRAVTSGLRLGVVSRRLLAWRDRPDSASRTHPRYALDRFAVCKAHYLARGFLRGGDSYVLWGYGDTGRVLRSALAAHGKLPSHIVEVKTSRVGQRIHGTPVVPIAAVPTLRGIPIVVSVARLGPRTEVRAALTAADFVEGRDYICAA